MESKVCEMLYTNDDVDQVLEEIRKAFAKGDGNCRDASSLYRLRGKMTVVLAGISAHPVYGSILEQLRSHDEYTYRHSIGVAILARWIGQASNMSRAELKQLTEAALLHDVGKLNVPAAILTKPSMLSEDEFCEIRLHSEYGHQLLRSADERIANVALQHHEREDGSGYPYNLTSERIDPWSKIVAVADVCHAMISTRVYKAPVSVLKVLRAMSDEDFGALAADPVSCIQRKVMTLLIGEQVMLSSGVVGRIVMLPYHAPMRPVVEVNGTFIELSKHPELEMACLVNEDEGGAADGSNLGTD